MAVNAGKPGSARVDSYTFFAEVSTADAPPPVHPQAPHTPSADKVILHLKIGHEDLVHIRGICSECPDDRCGGEIPFQKNVAFFDYSSTIMQGGTQVGIPVAEKMSPPPEFDPFRLGTGARDVHLIDSHIRARIEVAATVSSTRPALCTFSGTVNIIRAP